MWPFSKSLSFWDNWLLKVHALSPSEILREGRVRSNNIKLIHVDLS